MKKFSPAIASAISLYSISLSSLASTITMPLNNLALQIKDLHKQIAIQEYRNADYQMNKTRGQLSQLHEEFKQLSITEAQLQSSRKEILEQMAQLRVFELSEKEHKTKENVESDSYGSPDWFNYSGEQ